MLPIVTEEHASLAFAEIFQDVHGWRTQSRCTWCLYDIHFD